MTIIKIEPLESGQRPIQSQSHRKEVWLEGYVEVPAHLEGAAWESLGWCELELQDGRLVGLTPLPRPAAEPSREERISALKDELAATDYQIIKCSEYQLAGQALPYDLAALHAQRQGLRDQINELEAEA